MRWGIERWGSGGAAIICMKRVKARGGCEGEFEAVLTFPPTLRTIVLRPRTRDSTRKKIMKGQDIFLLLKIVSLSKRDHSGNDHLSSHWQDWDAGLESEINEDLDGYDDLDWFNLAAVSTHEHSSAAQYSLRALAAMTGISKSQVGLSLNRCYANGLAYPDRITSVPKINTTALGEFIIYGLKYVFPASRGSLTRGIATAWAAPVLSNAIMSGGETPLVWPDARGNTKGQALEPIYKTVPLAIRKDPVLYNLLALTDSIRTGQAREKAAAADLLVKSLDHTYV